MFYGSEPCLAFLVLPFMFSLLLIMIFMKLGKDERGSPSLEFLCFMTRSIVGMKRKMNYKVMLTCPICRFGLFVLFWSIERQEKVVHKFSVMM